MGYSAAWAVSWFQSYVEEQKYFQPVTAGHQTALLDLLQTLYHVAVKTGFYRKAVKVYYIPSPVTFSPTKLGFPSPKFQAIENHF